MRKPTIIINSGTHPPETAKEVADRYRPLDKKQARANFVIAAAFMLLGLGLITLGTLFMFGNNPLNATGSGWGGIAAGIGCTAVGGYQFLMRAIIKNFIPTAQLNERLNTDQETLDSIMQQRKIKPRFVVNGNRYYSASDFGEVGTLMRASSLAGSSVATRDLLVPASSIETVHSELLRGSQSVSEETAGHQQETETAEYMNRTYDVEPLGAEEQINRLE